MSLRFFVNDATIADDLNAFPRPSSGDAEFRARVRLPHYLNTIEVRYEWGGETYAFTPPAVLSGITVAVPAVRLDPALPKRTKDNHITVAGGIVKVLAAAQASAGPLTPVEIEVDTLAQLDEALAGGAAVRNKQMSCAPCNRARFRRIASRTNRLIRMRAWALPILRLIEIKKRDRG